MAWRITAWSRERGRGEIVSGIGRLAFDASVATVDDFEVGELVHVSLRPRGETWDVTAISPDLPRFRPRTSGVGVPLAVAMRAPANEALNRVGQGDHAWHWTLREERGEDTLTFAVRDLGDAYAQTQELHVRGPVYVELPVGDECLVPRFVRLSDDNERNYLATRVALGSSLVALTLVDFEGRFYFVVGRNLEA